MFEAILLSEHNIDADIDFQKDIDDSFSVLHWQCKGDFSLDACNNLCISPTSINQKAHDFLRLARETAASLVLTPEYSTPWECINRIVSDPTLQPDQGKLWCLCMQYLPLRAFEEWLSAHKARSLDASQQEPGCMIIWDGVSVRKQFVNILAYVFHTTSGQLVILLQSKLCHMRDPQFQFEASGLSLGRTIYLFDNGNHNTRAFCSMICADALDSHFYEATLQKLRDRKVLVFHPQLNPDPYFADIIRYVDVYIDRQWNFLRLNWTPDTKLLGSPLRKPGTGYIYKADRNMETYWNSPSDRKNYIQNRAKGLHFLMNKSLRAHWLFPPESHAALYYLRHPRPAANAAHTPHALTTGGLYYYINEDGWTINTDCPWPAFRAIIPSEEQKVLDFLTGIHCKNCTDETCALLMVDRFISMLRGIRDHEVINETPPNSHGNGCATNIACDLLAQAQMEWRHADMIGAYLRNICEIAGTTDDINLQALQYIVPDGVRIEVPNE